MLTVRYAGEIAPRSDKQEATDCGYQDMPQRLAVLERRIARRMRKSTNNFHLMLYSAACHIFGNTSIQETKPPKDEMERAFLVSVHTSASNLQLEPKPIPSFQPAS